jgi:hypothetical protein
VGLRWRFGIGERPSKICKRYRERLDGGASGGRERAANPRRNSALS